MKANWKVPLSPQAQRLFDEVFEELAEQRKKEQNESIIRALKLSCIVLNDEFGFGKERLKRFLNLVTAESDNVFRMPTRWAHYDDRLKDMGINLPREDVEAREKHSEEVKKKRRRS
jgi:hypothetical protein